MIINYKFTNSYPQINTNKKILSLPQLEYPRSLNSKYTWVAKSV